MGLFDNFRKRNLNNNSDADYLRYLKLVKDINEGKVSEDLLNTDPNKRGLTQSDIELIIKFRKQ